MITDGSRTHDTILVYLYSLIGVSSLNVLELSEDLREGGLDVTDKEVKREVEVLRRKGLLSFTTDYIEESTCSVEDDPLWVTSVGCSAAKVVMSRIADTVVVAANDTKNNDNGTFLFNTEAQHGGKQRDGEARTLHGFKIDSPGILSRDNNSSNSLIAYPDPNTQRYGR